MVGATLDGSFRLTRLLGEGGMGAVYEGVQLRLNKRVAVKLMSRDLSANQEALARFRREAELTSQLGHPHIVNVFDFGAAPSGEPYLVMEFLEGEDLEQRLRRVGRLPLAEAIRVCKQVASALAATHAKGIVHRDLKPANVFLMRLEGDADFVEVLDFGISKAKAAATKLTRASQIMGTPHYMAPEQATGNVDEIDARTDEWSLACIVWEMLSGRGPFLGDDVAALLYQVVHQDPAPLAAKVPGLPTAVEATLRKALAKKQADRFASVTAFVQALEKAAVATSVSAETHLGVPAPKAPPAKETVSFGAPQPAAGAAHDTIFSVHEEVAPTVIAGSPGLDVGGGGAGRLAGASAGAAVSDQAPLAPPAMNEARPRPLPTTFSRTAAEVGATAFVRKVKPQWIAAAGAGAVLVVVVALIAGGSSKPTGTAPTEARAGGAGAQALGNGPTGGQVPGTGPAGMQATGTGPAGGSAAPATAPRAPSITQLPAPAAAVPSVPAAVDSPPADVNKARRAPVAGGSVPAAREPSVAPSAAAPTAAPSGVERTAVPSAQPAAPSTGAGSAKSRGESTAFGAAQPAAREGRRPPSESESRSKRLANPFAEGRPSANGASSTEDPSRASPPTRTKSTRPAKAGKSKGSFVDDL